MNLSQIDLIKYQKVIVDLGCGSGKQILRQARKSPENFYIGIDSNPTAFEEVKKSLKKNKIENLIFVHANANNLPSELENKVDEIQINFPWGSLLEGIIIPVSEILENIVKIAKNNAELIIYTTYDDKFEKEFRLERKLPELTNEYINVVLKPAYEKLGISITGSKLTADSSKLDIDSPWGKKILSNRNREVYFIRGIIEGARS
jgi:16S rRNA (adenine(1408)-N(1))-methyltransferase